MDYIVNNYFCISRTLNVSTSYQQFLLLLLQLTILATIGLYIGGFVGHGVKLTVTMGNPRCNKIKRILKIINNKRVPSLT